MNGFRQSSLCFPVVVAMVMIACQSTVAQRRPEFLPGQDPKPYGKQWVKISHMSDEFDGDSLDVSKWQNTDPSRWIGRPPGIFKQEAVSVANSNLQITNYLLDQPEWHNGNQFTHAGGHVISQFPAYVGYYCEARMKANKTFMSSTFWLINYSNEFEGCDRRTTELDIQECVGQVTTNANWARDFDESMHSNTHSRNVTCNHPVGSRGNNILTNGKVWADYHTYGAWWKSPTEIQFFLDGNYIYSVTPYADFDLRMYLKLVTETYDWNPVPADGGMNGTWQERTTFYDWVRTWKLVDTPWGAFRGHRVIKPVTPRVDVVSFNAPTTVHSETQYTLSVNYFALKERDIVIEFWDDNWIASARSTVQAGRGTANITFDLALPPAPGTNYTWKASIRPVGKNWQSNLDLTQLDNVTVTTEPMIENGRYVLVNRGNDNNLGAPSWSNVGNNYNAITLAPGNYADQKWDFTHLGNNIYQVKLACCNRFLQVPSAECLGGANISADPESGASHQQWKLVEYGDSFMLKPLHCETHALERSPNSPAPERYGNDNVHLWLENSSNINQLWEVLVDDSP